MLRLFTALIFIVGSIRAEDASQQASPEDKTRAADVQPPEPPIIEPGKRTVTKISTTQSTVLIDTQDVPDLKDWGEKAGRLCVDWFPKIAVLLPSDGFVSPMKATLFFDPKMKGVAHAVRDRITLSADFVRAHPDDFGMVIHELTHVVQSYPAGGPGWLVEGIADYIRIVHFEPGAPRPKLTRLASYKDAYKTAAMFLEWIEVKHKPGLVKELNAILRQGTYRDECWTELTGKSVDALWSEFVSQKSAP